MVLNAWLGSVPAALRVAAAAAVCLIAAAAPADAWRGPYEDGERVTLTGVVTDPAGLPISGVHVRLEAARSRFDVRRFGKVKQNVTHLTDLTNDRGEYTIEWPWNGYYNTFELQVGVPTRSPNGEELRILERVDVTQRIKAGSPVVSALVVQNAAFIANLRQFLATIQSQDEKRVHQEMGEPDKVERFEYGDRTEVVWWFFGAGKAYRFRDGRLERIEPFSPVTPIDGDAKKDG